MREVVDYTESSFGTEECMTDPGSVKWLIDFSFMSGKTRARECL